MTEPIIKPGAKVYSDGKCIGTVTNIDEDGIHISQDAERVYGPPPWNVYHQQPHIGLDMANTESKSVITVIGSGIGAKLAAHLADQKWAQVQLIDAGVLPPALINCEHPLK